MVSSIVHVNRNGLQWKDAPKLYGPHKPLDNRFIRKSRLGVFDRFSANLAAEGPMPGHVMIDATHLKAHRTAASLRKRGSSPPYGRSKGGLNAKLHVGSGGHLSGGIIDRQSILEETAATTQGRSLRIPAGSRKPIGIDVRLTRGQLPLPVVGGSQTFGAQMAASSHGKTVMDHEIQP